MVVLLLSSSLPDILIDPFPAPVAGEEGPWGAEGADRGLRSLCISFLPYFPRKVERNSLADLPISSPLPPGL